MTSGRSRPSSEQVDTDQYVEVTQTQTPEDLDAFDGVDVGMQVPHPNAQLEQIVGEILGHLLGQRGDQHPVLGGHFGVDLLDQIIDLALRGLHHDLGIHQPGGTHDLLDDLRGHPDLVVRRGGGHEDALVDPILPLLETQRPVVRGGRQPESVLDQGELARPIALVLPVDLRDGLMGFVENHQEILREEVQQRVRCLSGTAAVDRCRVVLDAGAEPDLGHHLQVVLRAHPQPLRFEQLALGLEVGQPLL